ncbi:tetrapyrrole (Corrin/Porphyrin) methylase [Candidatus Phytoplasma mali]|uniref:Ribosomal RNA small subunit methyltransferase I n=1 Tax=Phytoplasma mali (strain AT) TaxID=482235 RepID=B3QZF5_PHYMT|nr:16S rRNA (cytidine(1402)-2'-O)-methyltransferase [Candidatus Phytoplasma mali]CAP18562.1 tetrapyrrole (Corrin/Porphyrin) methylase [Candidatus Phytoplasma mali]
MFLSQKSFIEIKPTLYLVSTPIGNLSDITLRALQILKSVDFILAEDTRISKKLLNFYDIKKPIISFYQYNQQKRLNKILQLLTSNHNLALISDAGTPLISDPGDLLVQEVQTRGFHTIAIPGVTAFLTAFITSSFKLPLIFLGFLPRSQNKKKLFLLKYQFCEATLLIYESSYRVLETLQLLKKIYGNRNISLARELTKKFEQIINTSLEEILKKELFLKGEYVIVIEGFTKSSMLYENFSLLQHIQFYLKQGFSEKESFHKVAKERKISKREIYKKYKI